MTHVKWGKLSELKYFYAKNSSWNTGGCSKDTFRQSSIHKEHVCLKYFVGISANKEKKKEKSCSEESL